MSLPYPLTRSRKRKTISILVKPDGKVCIKAPQFTSMTIIKKFVESKQAWIISTINKTLNTPQKTHLSIKNKTHLTILEKNISIESLEQSIKSKINSPQDLHLALKKTYHQEIHNRTLSIAKTIGPKTPQKITLRSMKSRWGSCNSKSRIGLNSWLLLAPLYVLDYVIIHECCHLYHLDHSEKFWDLVRTHDPAFKKAKSWLINFGHTITPE